MIRTSNFAKSGNHPNAVAISRTTPEWYKGRIYPELYPPQKLLEDYKNGLISQETYTHRYSVEVLAKLDPHDVVDTIGDDAIMICFESSEKFCHRRLVAKWLEDALEIRIPEVGKIPRKSWTSEKRLLPGQTTLVFH